MCATAHHQVCEVPSFGVGVPHGEKQPAVKVRLADGTASKARRENCRQTGCEWNVWLVSLSGWAVAHKVKLCKKTGFLQRGTSRVFLLSVGSPSGNTPTWAGQVAGALLHLPLCHRGPSSIIAHGETHLYVGIAWPVDLLCDAPRLKDCGRRNRNEWGATGGFSRF